MTKQNTKNKNKVKARAKKLKLSKEKIKDLETSRSDQVRGGMQTIRNCY